jgi:hypothetical protein
VRIEQRYGRLWIHATGRVGYNGLTSAMELRDRDVELVCRAGIEGPADAGHVGLVHLCGSGGWSPDHWFEVQLRGDGEDGARATIGASAPPYPPTWPGDVHLPPAGGSGYLVKIECEEATSLCRGAVKAGGRWMQVGEPVEGPARKARAEVKVQGWRSEGGSSLIWFDDCRLYPRPETYFLTVGLRRPDGSLPGAPLKSGWPPRCFDPKNRPVDHRNLVVKLFAADGETLVGESMATGDLATAIFRLTDAPWDVYPAPAILRVFMNGVQIGPDHEIASEGVEGLYPDDVYALTLD